MKSRSFISAALLAASVLLPSCAEYPVSGSLFLRDPESGAKGGLTFKPGEAPVAFGKAAIRDPETGEIIGYAEISTPLRASEVTPDK